MSQLFMDSITRVRAPLVMDKYGNASLRDWNNAARLTVTGVSVQPNGPADGVAEGVGDRANTGAAWRLFTHTGQDLDLLATDRVEFAGETLEVDGELARFRFGGKVHHVEARLKRVTG